MLSGLSAGSGHMFYLNGQLQTYGSDYTISGTTLTIVDGRPAPISVDVLTLYGSVGFVSYGITDLSYIELELAIKTGQNSYMEVTYSGATVTQMNYWTDVGKSTKLFTKDYTYTSGDLTQIVTTDEIDGFVLTETITYSGTSVASITKIVT